MALSFSTTQKSVLSGCGVTGPLDSLPSLLMEVGARVVKGTQPGNCQHVVPEILVGVGWREGPLRATGVEDEGGTVWSGGIRRSQSRIQYPSLPWV